MWHELVEDYDLDVHGTDKGNSFLVGDAAGRHGDHSAVDRFVCVLPRQDDTALLMSAMTCFQGTLRRMLV